MKAHDLIESLVTSDDAHSTILENGFSSQDKGQTVTKAFKGGGGSDGGKGHQVAPEPKAGKTTGSDHTTKGGVSIKDVGQPVKKAFKGAGSGAKGEQVAPEPKAGKTSGKDYTTTGKPTSQDKGQPIKKAVKERFEFAGGEETPDDELIDRAASGKIPGKQRPGLKRLGGDRPAAGGNKFSWRKKFGGDHQPSMESGVVGKMADRLLEAPPAE